MILEIHEDAESIRDKKGGLIHVRIARVRIVLARVFPINC